jgi:autotransporter-associated beta strand protein
LVGVVSYVIYAVCFPDSVFSRPIVRARIIRQLPEPHIDFLPASGGAGGGDVAMSGHGLASGRGGGLGYGRGGDSNDMFFDKINGSEDGKASPTPALAAAPPPVVLAPTPTAAPAAPASAPEPVMRPSEIVKNGVEADLPADESRGDSLGISGSGWLGGKGAATGGGGIGVLAQNEASGNTWSENKSPVAGRAMDAGSTDGTVTRGLRAGVGTASSTSTDGLLADRKSKETDSFSSSGTGAPAKPALARTRAVNWGIEMNAGEISVDKSALASSETTSTLSGENSYTGGTTVSGGTLNMGSGGRALGDVSERAPATLNYAFRTAEDMGKVTREAETKPMGQETAATSNLESTAPDANGFQGTVRYGSQIDSGVAANAPATSPASSQGPSSSVTSNRSEILNHAVRERDWAAREGGEVQSPASTNMGLVDGRTERFSRQGVGSRSLSANSDGEIKTGLDAVDYEEAKKEYEESADMLQRMKLKVLEEQTRAKAAHGTVIIHDEASPAREVSTGEQLAERANKALGGLLAKDAETRAPMAKKPQPQEPVEKPRLAQNKAVRETESGSGTMAATAQQKLRELKSQDDSIRNNPAVSDEHTQNADKVRKALYIAESYYNLGKFDESKREYENAIRVDPYNKAARRGMERVTAAKSDYFRAAYDETRATLLAQVDNTWEMSVPKAKEILAAMDESAANRDPYSTFSLHVSDASFKLAKAALDRGDRPDPSTVRPEEFYNAFDYGDPAPAAGEPVACTLEQSAHPVLPQRNLVRIAARVGSAGRSGAQPLVLTVLLDSSGSMEREDRHAGLKNAVAQLASLLHADDRVTLVTFSRTPRLLADRLPGSQAAKLKELVGNTPSEGGTNLEEALKLGGTLAMRQKQANAQNRIVLLTDGAANLGDANPEHLAGLIHDLRQQGIAFDAAGIGADGLNDRMLEQLTRNGNGRYYVINNPEDADANFAKQLAGAFHPAAENVKVQVRFNQERVGRYKLIGFEQHRLRTEDFRNDKVDAAELAADEAGVALYQVETLPQGRGEVGEVSIRFRDASSGGMVERTWTIPYDEKAPAFDQAAPSMQLATLAALTAEKLRGSELGKVIDFQTLAGPIALVRGNYQSNARVADLVSMIEKLK